MGKAKARKVFKTSEGGSVPVHIYTLQGYTTSGGDGDRAQTYVGFETQCESFDEISAFLQHADVVSVLGRLCI